MAERYLNESCFFQCDQCVEGCLYKAEEPIVTKSNINGKNVLTNNARLSIVGAGTCKLKPNPSGTPPYLPCTVNVIKWNSCSKNRAGQSNLLTEKSTGKCVIPGGKLSASVISTRQCIKDEVKQRVLRKTEYPVLKNREEKKNNAVENTIISASSIESMNKLIEAQNKNLTESLVMLKCPFSLKKEKCRNCEYVNTSIDGVLSSRIEGIDKTPSQLLRSNYKEHFKEVEETRKYYQTCYNSYEEEIRLFSDNLAGNEAHHVLSTNDVLKQPAAKFVLQLVNFYHLDINNAMNCILLAGNGDRGSYGSFAEEKKLEEQFRVMSKVKRQWHGSGHSFVVEDENFLGSYASKVTELLVNVMNNLSDSYCRIDEANYEKGKKEFEQKFWAVVDEVRKSLVQFERNPQYSQPYYVSKAAFQYAYGLKKVSFAVLRCVEEGIYSVSKYAVSRGNKNQKALIFDLKGEKNFNAGSKKEMKLLVLFLGQINIALIEQTVGKVSLPFSIKNIVEVRMGGMKTIEFLEQEAETLFMRFSFFESEEDENGIMRKRLFEMKGENDE